MTDKRPNPLEDRNQVLDIIEGPRTYNPPPNSMIVRMVNPPEKTKGGVLLVPGGSAQKPDSGDYATPLGEVLAHGKPAGDKWPEFVEKYGVPFPIGSTVYLMSMLPQVRLHSGLAVIPWENVVCYIDIGEDSTTESSVGYTPPVPVSEVHG